tara:strand:- start:1 stop:261 length:261 start_codon:yes stop_codon:yes gene_type:complete
LALFFFWLTDRFQNYPLDDQQHCKFYATFLDALDTLESTTIYVQAHRPCHLQDTMQSKHIKHHSNREEGEECQMKTLTEVDENMFS